MKWKKRHETLPSTCCWCEKEIPQDSPAYSLPATFRKDVETPPVKNDAYLTELVVPKSMDSKQFSSVWAIVTAKKSDAKKDGADLVFVLCSEKCGRELKEILRVEIKFM